MVEVADRGRRSEEREPAIEHERAQDEHVVALVGVPGAADREVAQPEHGRDGEDRKVAEQLEPIGADAGDGSREPVARSRVGAAPGRRPSRGLPAPRSRSPWTGCP